MIKRAPLKQHKDTHHIEFSLNLLRSSPFLRSSHLFMVTSSFSLLVHDDGTVISYWFLYRYYEPQGVVSYRRDLKWRFIAKRRNNRVNVVSFSRRKIMRILEVLYLREWIVALASAHITSQRQLDFRLEFFHKNKYV